MLRTRTLLSVCAIASTIFSLPAPSLAQDARSGAGSAQINPLPASTLPPQPPTSSPLSISAHMDAEVLAVVGGTGRRQSASTVVAQTALTWDTGRAGLWPGGQFRVSLAGLRTNADFAAASGDLQLPSNIWATNFLRVYQATYRQDFGANFVQAGIMDVNSLFDVTEVAGQLLNASFGISPTLTANANIATYPSPGLGLAGGMQLGSGRSIQAGLWQADPPSMTGALNRGALAIVEGAQDWNLGSKGQITAKLGLWHQHNAPLGRNADSNGLYGLGQWTWDGAGGTQWGTFVQIGSAPRNTDGVYRYLAAGLRAQGLSAARPDDVLSIGVARATPTGLQPETVMELVYSMPIAPHVYLQPDVQHILHPGGGPGTQTVAGLRIHIER